MRVARLGVILINPIQSVPVDLAEETLDEYVGVYRDAWSDPEVRWLLSTVPVAMIFDDHDVRDDWNTSAVWRAEMREKPWWRDRVRSALASYWI